MTLDERCSKILEEMSRNPEKAYHISELMKIASPTTYEAMCRRVDTMINHNLIEEMKDGMNYKFLGLSKNGLCLLESEKNKE